MQHHNQQNIQTQPKKSYTKTLVLACVLCIFLLSVAVNYINVNPLEPHASDEHAYIGLANRYIFLQNKTPLFFPWQPQGTGLLSYSLGIVSRVSSVSVEAVFRIAHVLTLLFIVLSSYRLGKVLSLRTAPLLIFTSLFALFPSTGTWQGPAGMTPSTLAIIPILNIITNLIAKKWGRFSIWILLLTLIHWWLLIPIAVFLFVYFLFHYTHSLSRFFITLGIIAIVSLFAQPLVKLYVPKFGSLMQSSKAIFEGTPYWGGTYYFQFLPSHVKYFLPIILPSFLYAVIQIYRLRKSDQKPTPLQTMGPLLLITSILLLFMGGPMLLSRSITLFFIGTFLLVAYFFSFIVKKSAKLMPLLFGLLFIVDVVHVSQTNAQQFFTQISMTRAERFLIRQLQQNKNMQGYLIVSDFNSMLNLTNYLDTPINILLDTTSPKYIGLDLRKLMTFFTTPAMSLQKYEFLDTLKTNTHSKVLYILVSDRTRVYANSFLTTGDPIGYRGVPRNFAIYGEVPAERKLSTDPFKLILKLKDTTDNSFATLYEYKPVIK